MGSEMCIRDRLQSRLEEHVEVQMPNAREEPYLSFNYEARYVNVYTTLISSQMKKWRGRLYIGSISAAVSREWLQWAGVTHVVCVLGKYAGSRLAPEWSAASENRFRGILYLDWPINSARHRKRWREVFDLLSDALTVPANAVLVHCVNGKDRSPFTLYAFFRLVYEMDHMTALSHVNQRIGKSGRPLFDISRQSVELRQWIDDNLGSQSEVESGLCSWTQGSR